MITFSTIKAALITNSLQSYAQILSSCCSCTSEGGDKTVRRKQKHAILGMAGFYSLVVLSKADLDNSNGNLLGQNGLASSTFFFNMFLNGLLTTWDRQLLQQKKYN